MNTEEKARAYDEALERAIEFQKSKDGLCVLTAESIFPELRESEDERVIRTLYYLVRDHDWLNGATKGEVLAYLEKQKDHFRDDTKKVEKQDYSSLNDLERAIHRGFLSAGVENVSVTIIKETAKECLEQVKPAEWSEEDKKDVAHIIRILDDCYAYGRHDLSKTDHENLVNKLKSLRPVSKESLQPHWKPSKEQIATLEKWLKDKQFDGASRYVYPIFESLYEQLKKLM